MMPLAAAAATLTTAVASAVAGQQLGFKVTAVGTPTATPALDK